MSYEFVEMNFLNARSSRSLYQRVTIKVDSVGHLSDDESFCIDAPILCMYEHSSGSGL